MPQVVDQTGDMRNALAKRGPGLKSWKVNPALFPCDLSDEAMSLAKDAGGFCNCGESWCSPLSRCLAALCFKCSPQMRLRAWLSMLASFRDSCHFGIGADVSCLGTLCFKSCKSQLDLQTGRGLAKGRCCMMGALDLQDCC